jgi:hypothetical protein
MTSIQAPSPKATAGHRPARLMPLRLERSDPVSRRRAAAVLEVMGGVRTPADAAKALGISLPAYYKLESRALEGLIEGCKPLDRGPRPSVEVELRRLRRDCQRLQQDVGRYQALARAAQRAVGLAQPAVAPKADARGRRSRRPAVRALRAVASLQVHAEENEPLPPSSPLVAGGAG